MSDLSICGINITSPEKIISKGIKKIDMIRYYEKICDNMLPFIKNRYISEVRCHNKLCDCFFKKHPDKSNNLITVKSKEDLIKEAQLGTLEFHLYGNNITLPSIPNIMVFDLDPDEEMPHRKLVFCVMKLKALLDSLNLKSYLKTSGGKGYHVVIPFKKTKGWRAFEKFAENVALTIAMQHPELFTTNIRKAERKGKIFVDYLRNKKGSTCVAPYSLRARENLPISLPIEWKDITNIKPNQVTIKNIDKYINKNAWRGFFKPTQILN